jgi:hydrogenase expression/formation protein HypE
MGIGAIRAVLFDFDGTLTSPGALDFPFIRAALGCPEGLPILEFIQTIEAMPARQSALDRLDGLEAEAAGRSRPNAGAQELIRWLRSHHMALGIVTRNSRLSVIRALANFDDLDAAAFDLIVSRDDPPRPKPSGEGVLWAARKLNLPPEQILVVGDFIYDCQAARAAGSMAVLLDPVDDPRLQSVDCDYRIRSLSELKILLQSLNNSG